jgi:hypothetical protein
MIFDKKTVGGFKKGNAGVISGPGTGTSDSIPAFHVDGKKVTPIYVSNDESILTAKATGILGEDFINGMNSGKIKGFSTGAVMGNQKVVSAGAKPAVASAQVAPQVTNKNDTTIINAIDSSSVLAAAMETPAGNRVMMNYLTANKSKIQRIIR